MPIIWRFLLGQYLKVFILCTLSFIAVLLTMRLDEIAHFATLGADTLFVLLYTLYQIPFILPIAIPISALISVVILIQRLSTSHELTALRGCGMSLQQILAPLLMAALWLSLLNFFIVSELATHSHLSGGLLKTELRSVNPLLLLHNKHLMQIKGMYFDTLGASHIGENAADVIVASPNKNNSRINVMIAENLQANASEFIGTGVTLLTSLKSDDKTKFDHLMIENIGEAKTSIQDFAQMLQKKVWVVNNDHLQLPLLMVRLNEEKADWEKANKEGRPIVEQKQIERCINRCYTEIFRRLSVAMAVFTFTLMGAAFGISISRYKSNRSIIYIALLAALFLMAYFMAKGIDHLIEASTLLYFVPHVLIVMLSLFVLRRVAKGVE